MAREGLMDDTGVDFEFYMPCQDGKDCSWLHTFKNGETERVYCAYYEGCEDREREEE